MESDGYTTVNPIHSILIFGEGLTQQTKVEEVKDNRGKTRYNICFSANSGSTEMWVKLQVPLDANGDHDFSILRNLLTRLYVQTVEASHLEWEKAVLGDN